MTSRWVVVLYAIVALIIAASLVLALVVPALGR